MQPESSGVQNASVDITDDAGRVITSLLFPADPLMFHVVKKVIGGNEYRRYPPSFKEPVVVVDVGANVGAAAVMFKIRYPQATVFAFEPSPDMFAFLRQNVKAFSGIMALPVGLYQTDSRAPLYTGHRSAVENSLFPNEATAADSQYAQLKKASGEFLKLGIDRISILKIDTEGAELPILNDIENWLDKTELIFIEYHSEEDRLGIDRMLSPHFILADFAFDSVHRGRMTYLSKIAADRIPDYHQHKISRDIDQKN